MLGFDMCPSNGGREDSTHDVRFAMHSPKGEVI